MNQFYIAQTTFRGVVYCSRCAWSGLVKSKSWIAVYAHERGVAAYSIADNGLGIHIHECGQAPMPFYMSNVITHVFFPLSDA